MTTILGNQNKWDLAAILGDTRTMMCVTLDTGMGFKVLPYLDYPKQAASIYDMRLGLDDDQIDDYPFFTEE